MPRKTKIRVTEKVELVEAIVFENESLSEVAKRSGIARRTLRDWVSRYHSEGRTAFLPQEKNRVYGPEEKEEAVKEYLRGGIGLQKICEKYKIRSTAQLRQWIKRYNSHEDFKPRSGGSRMTNRREVAKNERIRIVKECIESNYNYGEVAIKNKVSYQQVYTWTQKYKEMGESGLEDRRGKRKAKQEFRTQEEELQIRIAQLEHENYMLRMERDLLKKAEELERRDAYRR